MASSARKLKCRLSSHFIIRGQREENSSCIPYSFLSACAIFADHCTSPENFQRRVLRTLEVLIFLRHVASDASQFSSPIYQDATFTRLLDGENCYFVASEMRCRRLFHSNVALFGHNVALLYVLLSRSKLSSNFSDLLNVGPKIIAKYKSRRMPLSNSQS